MSCQEQECQEQQCQSPFKFEKRYSPAWKKRDEGGPWQFPQSAAQSSAKDMSHMANVAAAAPVLRHSRAALPDLAALRPRSVRLCAPAAAAQLPTRLPNAPSPPEITADDPGRAPEIGRISSSTIVEMLIAVVSIPPVEPEWEPVHTPSELIFFDIFRERKYEASTQFEHVCIRHNCYKLRS